MIKFTEKAFSKKIGKVLKNSGKYIKDHPLLPLSTITATVSTANLVTNRNRDKKDREYQEKQLIAMEKLTRSLDNNSKTISNSSSKLAASNSKNSSSNVLRKKIILFSLKEDVINGAMIGAGLGFGLTRSPFKNPSNNKDKGKSIPDWKISLIGAGLGAIVGSLKWASGKISRRTSKRFLSDNITDRLLVSGYSKDKDFTKNPKIADLLKTKVCVVLSKSHSEMKILINTANEQKLNKLLEKIIKQENPSEFSNKRSKSGEKFNELVLTSLPTSEEKDILYIMEIIETFIRNGYPVYIVEVG